MQVIIVTVLPPADKSLHSILLVIDHFELFVSLPSTRLKEIHRFRSLVICQKNFEGLVKNSN